MAATPTYRFFPWVRRGLSGALPAAAGPLPARGLAKVKIVVTAELVAQREVRLLGPGDVVGIDQRLVVRTEPRAAAHDFEPNYVAAVDFDAPELPWLFTPAGAGPDGRLPPWLVLVVVDRDLVQAPRVSRNRPLPFIVLAGSLAATELPNLDESWAWAHVQRLSAGPGEDDAQALLDQPDLNVSRLIAPRRLAPNRRWMACVVPAFDAGIAAGLGIPRPNPDAPLAPAWTPGSTDVELPVYHYWEFDTGLAGDFEFLARRLKPVRLSAAERSAEDARRARVFLGTVDGRADTLAAMPPSGDASAAGAYARLDAPLEMMDTPAATVAEVPDAFSSAVERATKPSSTEGEGEAPAASQDLLPPLYGDRHAGRFSVSAAERASRWLDELNLDPRTRVAARCGGDTVRRFQEDLMEAAWAQIGDVLDANAQIGRSRFLALVATRALERHVAGLPGPRVMALSAPMHLRLRSEDLSVKARITRTSLADSAFDSALRRLTSPVGRMARAVARSVEPARRVEARQVLSRGIAEALQRNEAAVDPSIVPSDSLGTFELGTSPRDDLATTGIYLEAHSRASVLAAQETGRSPVEILEEVRAAAAVSPNALQFAVRKPSADVPTARVVAIESDAAGALTMVDPVSRVRTPLLTLERAREIDASVLSGVIASMPASVLTQGTHRATTTIEAGRPVVSFELGQEREATPTRRSRTTRSAPTTRPGAGVENRTLAAGARVLRDDAIAQQDRLFGSVVFPPPVREASVLQSVTKALQQLAAAQPSAERAMRFVQAPIGAAGGGLPAQVKSAIEPARVFRQRAAAMVKVPSWIKPPAADVFDPIMAAPRLRMPFGELFGRVAPERFLPLDVQLPEESITALLTNPRFVAAFMVGANHEMNRELLWRTYPTDGRGTSIRRFWDWFDEGRLDVDALHAWPDAGPLIARGTAGSAQVVLVLRGRLLRRYPNTAVLLWKGSERGTLATVPDGDEAAQRDVLRRHVFRMPIGNDLTIVGFDITEQEFLQGDQAGWYVVLQEPLTEPRFGLDEPTGGLGLRRRNRDDLDWSGIAVGAHLPGTGGPLGSRRHAADVAASLLQRPVRVAIHATQVAPAFTST